MGNWSGLFFLGRGVGGGGVVRCQVEDVKSFIFSHKQRIRGHYTAIVTEEAFFLVGHSG